MCLPNLSHWFLLPPRNLLVSSTHYSALQHGLLGAGTAFIVLAQVLKPWDGGLQTASDRDVLINNKIISHRRKPHFSTLQKVAGKRTYIKHSAATILTCSLASFCLSSSSTTEFLPDRRQLCCTKHTHNPSPAGLVALQSPVQG